MWPGTPKDMIDHLIAGYSTGLVVLINTITFLRIKQRAANEAGPKE